MVKNTYIYGLYIYKETNFIYTIVKGIEKQKEKQEETMFI